MFRGGIGEMNVVASFKKLLGPLLFASAMAICLPFVVAFINIKVVGKFYIYAYIEHITQL